METVTRPWSQGRGQLLIPAALVALTLAGCGPETSRPSPAPTSTSPAITTLDVQKPVPDSAPTKQAADAAAAKQAADAAAAKQAADAAAAKQAADAAAAKQAADAAAAKQAADAAAAMPTRYRNCAELNQAYPHGVGRPGAVDRVAGGNPGVTTFERDLAIYNANTARDGDKDGIACERR